MNEAAHCPTCGHKLTPGRITLNANLAHLFVTCCRFAATREVEYRDPEVPNNNKWLKGTALNVVTVDDLKKNGLTVEYTIVAKLKYFGIIGQPHQFSRQGIYQITQLGYDFLRGNVEVPSWVDMRDRAVVGKSPFTITLEKALSEQWYDISDWILKWREGHKSQANRQMNLL